MLHKDPFLIAEDTFQLIIDLQEMDFMKGFHLVGGTALALQIGHRNSIDIDLFTQSEFIVSELVENLREFFGVTPTFQREKNTLLTVIEDIKVDFIRHNFPMINTLIKEEGISMFSLEDIAAMKVHAITNSGKRLKDFIDIYYLLEHFSIYEIIGFYAQKYPNYNPMIGLRAISYFGDIDPQIDPPKLRNLISIDEVKNRIGEAVIHSRKIF